MKKILYILGFGALGTAFYFYFKQQLELALSYDYKIATWRIDNLTDKTAEVEVTIQLQNKSAFEVTVEQYDLQIFYKDIPIARAISAGKTQILANSTIPIKMVGTIVFDEAKQALLPLVQTIYQQKPINVQVSGFVKVKFIGINSTITFNKDKFQYSADILAEYGLADKWIKLKEKLHL